MKRESKFKASRISGFIWIISLLVTAFFVLIFWLALSALLFSPHPKVAHDIMGIVGSLLVFGLLFFMLNRRGRNDKVLTRHEKLVQKVKETQDQITVNGDDALNVKNAWILLTIIGLLCLPLGFALLMMAWGEHKFGMSLLGLFIILVGIFVIIQRISSIGKTILSVDKQGITYTPTTLIHQQKYKRIPWQDINAVYLRTISAGRSQQTYLYVEVDHPDNYFPAGTKNKLKKHTNYRKFYNFGNKLMHVENVAIAVPVTMLKINKTFLEEYCQETLREYQVSHQRSDDLLIEE